MQLQSNSFSGLEKIYLDDYSYKTLQYDANTATVELFKDLMFRKVK